MENKLALDILKYKIFNGGLLSKDTLYSWIDKLKEIEKNNIIDAYDNGRQNWGNSKCGIEYYEENFKKDNI